MDVILILAGGVLLGILHSFDPDHIAAMTAQVAPGAPPRHAQRSGLLWGCGHSVALCATALTLAVLGMRVAPVFETGFEVAVGAVLIMLGLWRVSITLRDGRKAQANSHTSSMLPLWVGMLHGLAGTAGIMIMAPLLLLESLPAYAAYLVCFSAGSILSMTLFTSALARAQGALVTRLRQGRVWLGAGAGMLSSGVGVWWLLGGALAA
ncbi:MAG: hypothetical protein Q8L89_09210 [Gammaproteobacteria bacterium]|nr:hypothetical protein [Gammaproteobacteria bacterium]